MIFAAGNPFLVLEFAFGAAGISVLGLKFRSMDGVFGSNTINCIIRYTGICMGVYVYLYAYCRIVCLDLYMGYMGRLYGLVLEVVLVLKLSPNGSKYGLYNFLFGLGCMLVCLGLCWYMKVAILGLKIVVVCAL